VSLRFENEYGAIEVHSLGAALTNWSQGKRVIIRSMPSERQLQQWKYGFVLFPFAGRLSADNSLNFMGRELKWPVNEKSRNSALHGLSSALEFDLSVTDSGIVGICEYNGALKHFPFDFELSVHYRLVKDGVEQHVFVRNLSNEYMPYHLGWHPYFHIEGPMTVLSYPRLEMATDANLHPMATQEFSGLDWGKDIDTTFYFEEQECHVRDRIKEVVVKGPSNWLHLFKPHGMPLVSIEPITGIGHPDTPWKSLRPGEEAKHLNEVHVRWL
jgi:galactose mutarotase-like enzyme